MRVPYYFWEMHRYIDMKPIYFLLYIITSFHLRWCFWTFPGWSTGSTELFQDSSSKYCRFSLNQEISHPFSLTARPLGWCNFLWGIGPKTSGWVFPVGLNWIYFIAKKKALRIKHANLWNFPYSNYDIPMKNEKHFPISLINLPSFG